MTDTLTAVKPTSLFATDRDGDEAASIKLSHRSCETCDWHGEERIEVFYTPATGTFDILYTYGCGASKNVYSRTVDQAVAFLREQGQTRPKHAETLERLAIEALTLVD